MRSTILNPLRDCFYSAVLWGAGLSFLWSGYYSLSETGSWSGALLLGVSGLMIVFTDVRRYSMRLREVPSLYPEEK